MTQDHTQAPGAAESEVMGAVDDASGNPSYVIADISCDGAWLSAPEPDAVVPTEWC
ncbi:MAG: hypothetical protein J07HN6_00826 [Halonotius sp. J07HN6]|jgi:hypothetical protein|nr:MAG: hypothetical protein J07HN6_00826 [Halonotius sp. J07HN6]ESS08319.1 MAG: hypothetical protein A07HN63_01816 [uncultured archaeon A07HN63]